MQVFNVTKSRFTLVLMVAGVLGVASLSQAEAGVRGPGVNGRQQNQHQRVRQGVRSGELTRRETRNLAESQRDIRQLERAYKSDGQLTRAERVDLHHEQNQASRDIYKQKHDAQDRPVATPVAARDPGVNHRQVNQTGRIVNGVKTGELTHDEARELRDGRREIRQTEQQYKADGTLTRDERIDLHQDMNQQSRDIHEAKHNEETRGQ
ncbi:hypothetical protein GCM10011487_60770 [Steroidobacter agaridevorans]|uniref:Lipoprotein n=1 Tax=Steroidobacter agaridevorans TaxID=2695856 RepID=A0A829YL29_9GAMM|nr:hypothetical protein [Steroidobacter agaridevorans]GFE84077.1 hypothetical protein GCM10011487_60770 [Steroidobacter agaridevorans]